MAGGKTKILLVDDDEVARNSILLQLSGFGFETTPASDSGVALKLLESQAFDLVLSDVRMPKMDGLALAQVIRKRFPNLPILLMSEQEGDRVSLKAADYGADGLISKVGSKNDLMDGIREILDRIPGFETRDEDFARISISDFLAGKTLPFHIYVRVAKDRFIRVADQGQDLDLSRIRSYQERGIQFLYLRKHDFKIYFKTSVNLLHRVANNSQIPAEKKLRFLKHSGELIYEHCRIVGLDEEAMTGAREFLLQTLDAISDEEEFVDLLDLLNTHADFVYAHSLAVSMVSTAIARRMKWESEAAVFKLGMAGLLHDIGKKEIDRAVLAKPRHRLTSDERAQVETHPQRGLRILQAMGHLPEELVQAVIQHHEEPTGFGYPMKIQGLEISPMAQIVSLANIFCNYTVKNPSHPYGMTAAEAVLQMEHFDARRVTAEHFDALKSLCPAT